MERVRIKRKFQYDPSNRDYEARYGLKREKVRSGFRYIEGKVYGGRNRKQRPRPADPQFTRLLYQMLSHVEGSEALSFYLGGREKARPQRDQQGRFQSRDDREGGMLVE